MRNIRILEVNNMQASNSHLVQVRLKELREKFHYTQEAIASQLGITRKTYSLYENGEAMPNLEILLQLTEIFRVTLNDLVINHSNISESSSKAIIRLNRLMETLSPKKQIALYLKASGWAEGTEDVDLLED